MSLAEAAETETVLKKPGTSRFDFDSSRKRLGDLSNVAFLTITCPSEKSKSKRREDALT